MKTRKFEYKGKPILTRGDYGENVIYGYELNYDGCLYVWDTAFGWQFWYHINLAIQSGEWIEIPLDKEEK